LVHVSPETAAAAPFSLFFCLRIGCSKTKCKKEWKL